MKIRLFITVTLLLLTMLFFPGCQKPLQDQPGTASESKNELQSRGHPGEDKKECRLVLNEGDNQLSQTFRYNGKGFVEEWAYSEAGYSERNVFEYDSENRVSKTRYYVLGEFLYTVVFVYKKGRVVKQIWYVTDTDIIDDEIFITYNWKGQQIKQQSFLYDFYATYKYDFFGNAYKQEWFATDGTKLYEFNLSFTKPVKNPMLLVKGLPPSYGYYFWLSPWRQTGYKASYFDDDGNPVAYVDEDFRKSVLRAGSGNYASYQKFYDKVTDAWYEQTWCYENCGGTNDCGQRKTNNNNTANKTSSTKRNGLPFLHGPTKKIKERIENLGKEVLKKSK